MSKKNLIAPKSVLLALWLSGIVNYVLSFVVSITIGMYKYPDTGWREMLTFFLKFSLFSSLTFTVFFTAYAIIILLFNKLRCVTHLKYPIVSGILLLNLGLLVAQVLMYLEYGDGINIEIIHLFGQDGGTIYKMMDDEYDVSFYIGCLVVVTLLVPLCFRKVISSEEEIELGGKKIIGVFTILLLSGGGYGLFVGDVNNEKKNLKVLARDSLISAMDTYILFKSGEFRGFKRYLEHYLEGEEKATMETALNWAKAPLKKAKIENVFEREVKSSTLNAPFQLSQKPSHIFYIQLEGQDSIVYRNAELKKLSPKLLKLMKTGIYVPNFFPSSGQTNASSFATLTSYPIVDVFRTHLWGGKTKNALPAFFFKQFGYQSSIHSASYFEACGHGKLLEGLPSVIFKSYSDTYERESWSSVWGISDKKFVDDVKVGFRPEGKHFAMFMSVSNHPPYKVDVYEEGFNKSWLPEKFIKNFEKGGYDPIVRAGHYWYADREMGRLVDFLYEKYPQSLFIITADHWSRYSNDKNDVLAQETIPFVMWGPNVIPNEEVGRKDDWYGTHGDIFPTLVYLLEGEDFKIHAFGAPLWDMNKNFITVNSVGNNKYIYLNDLKKLYDYRTGLQVEEATIVRELQRWQAGMRAISYGVMMRGDNVK